MYYCYEMYYKLFIVIVVVVKNKKRYGLRVGRLSRIDPPPPRASVSTTRASKGIFCCYYRIQLNVNYYVVVRTALNEGVDSPV
jgi:hypothetical protein